MIVKRIKRRLYSSTKDAYVSMQITAIIKLYVYYAFLAVIHGYPVRIRWTAHINLVREKSRDLTERESKFWFKSRKLYGDMFAIKFSFVKNHQDHIFIPNKEISENLQNIIDSDDIYELSKS